MRPEIMSGKSIFARMSRPTSYFAHLRLTRRVLRQYARQWAADYVHAKLNFDHLRAQMIRDRSFQ